MLPEGIPCILELLEAVAPDDETEVGAWLLDADDPNGIPVDAYGGTKGMDPAA